MIKIEEVMRNLSAAGCEVNVLGRLTTIPHDGTRCSWLQMSVQQDRDDRRRLVSLFTEQDFVHTRQDRRPSPG